MTTSEEEMKIVCDYCHKILTRPGALVFHPPIDGMCRKEHICYDCFYTRHAPSGLRELDFQEVLGVLLTAKPEDINMHYEVDMGKVAKLICQTFGGAREIRYPEKIEHECSPSCMQTVTCKHSKWNEAIDEMRRLNSGSRERKEVKWPEKKDKYDDDYGCHQNEFYNDAIEACKKAHEDGQNWKPLSIDQMQKIIHDTYFPAAGGKELSLRAAEAIHEQSLREDET